MTTHGDAGAATSLDKLETETEKQQAFHIISSFFPVIEQWRGSTDLPVETGSPLRGDDRATDPYRASQVALRHLGVAADHLHALMMLLRDAQALHMYAPFSLLRPPIECAALTIWQLMPGGRDERIARTFRILFSDAKEEEQALALTGPASTGDNVRIARFRDIIQQRATLTEAEVLKRRPGLGSIAWQAGESFAVGGNAAELAWRACSGMTHGQLWTTLSMLDREQVGDTDGTVQTFRLSSPATKVAWLLKTAMAMNREARRLYLLRAKSP